MRLIIIREKYERYCGKEESEKELTEKVIFWARFENEDNKAGRATLWLAVSSQMWLIQNYSLKQNIQFSLNLWDDDSDACPV